MSAETQNLMNQAAANSTEGTQGSPVEAKGQAAPAAEAPKASEQQAATQEAKPEEKTAPAESKANETKVDAPKEPSKESPAELTDFTLPEGVQMDTEAMGDFKNLAKELGLKQEGAQKVADLGAKLSQKWEAKQAEQIQAFKDGLIESAKADKEIGGDKLPENMAVAEKALETFGTPELRTLLKQTGFGNHPEIIRAFYRAGKAISNDRFVTGANGPSQSSGERDFAKALYPSQGE